MGLSVSLSPSAFLTEKYTSYIDSSRLFRILFPEIALAVQQIGIYCVSCCHIPSYRHMVLLTSQFGATHFLDPAVTSLDSVSRLRISYPENLTWNMDSVIGRSEIR